MPTISKKETTKESSTSNVKDFIFSALRLVILFFYDFMKKYYIPAALTILFLIIVTGKFLTKEGLVLTSIILAFTVLHLIMKWLEKHEEN
jgi:hypothetical protein